MRKFIVFLSIMSLCSFSGFAQSKDANSLAKDANNPLATIKSISLHNVYTPSLFVPEGTMNTTWIRYAQPIGKVLIRASMPINAYNSGDFNRAGLGDFNVFGTYIFTKPTASNQMGLGPILTIPTATSSTLGSGKWQLGVAFAGYFASHPVFQCGILATWQHSFAGSGDRGKTNIATIQPFFMWQLGQDLYLRSTAIHALDFANKGYLFPMGMGIGKIVKVNNIICNIFAEPQFTIWHKGENMPKTQIFMGCNVQF